MVEVDNSYQLIYNHYSGNKIIFNDSLLEKLNMKDYSCLPADTTVFLEKIEFYKLVFGDGNELKIFRIAVNCKFKDLVNPIKIFSPEHFRIILERKIKEDVYNNPYYYSNFWEKNIYININKIEETKIYLETYIEIKDKETPNIEAETKSLYNELNSIYKEKGIKQYSYKFISPNFNSYFSDININLTDEFFFISAGNRIGLNEKINQFLDKNDSSFLYPLCGPHGTGKTISILTFHKLLFINGIKGLYLNLKYYCMDGITIEEKIKVLLKECFFICDNEEELLALYKNFITKNNIYELFISIKNFIQKKNEGEQKQENKENKDNKEKDKKIYIIIDQYQEIYSMNGLFDLFKNIKIILLSSINDFDVKDNIILTYKDKNEKNFNEKEDKNEKNKIIKYHYIDDLINTNFYQNKYFIELIKNKIKKKENDEKKIEKEFNFIYYILNKLGFIPKYFFKFLYLYDSILDLLFDEYSKIMKKLDIFLINRIIDIDTIENLKDNNHLIRKEKINTVQTLQNDDFIKSVKLIPLKYINFKECNNGEFYFYYSFPLLEKILQDFIEFQKDKKLFYTTEDGAERGRIFERILKFQFRVYKKFNLDGYFKVKTLIQMQPTKKYANINKEYIKSKKNIFIDQKENGEDYDFAIYKQNSKQLLLFQAKYIINSGTVVKKKSLYDKSAKDLLEAFNKLINENISEVYLLFISSIYYNYDNRKNVIRILSNKRINCIFYSLKKNLFYLNFKDTILDIELVNSYMLVPSSEYYENQKALNNSEFEKEVGIYKRNKSEFKKKAKKKKKKKEEKEEEEEEANIKKPKTIEKKKKSSYIHLLQKKTTRYNFNLTEMHIHLISYIQNNLSSNLKHIISLLGPIKSIEKDVEEIDFENEYAILFHLDENNFDIDYNRKLGLMIYNNGTQYYMDLKENKNYESDFSLIENFSINFLYAIGKKNVI